MSKTSRSIWRPNYAAWYWCFGLVKNKAFLLLHLILKTTKFVILDRSGLWGVLSQTGQGFVPRDPFLYIEHHFNTNGTTKKYWLPRAAGLARAPYRPAHRKALLGYPVLWYSCSPQEPSCSPWELWPLEASVGPVCWPEVVLWNWFQW